MMWILVVAHVATGPVNIKHGGSFPTLANCTEAGRQLERVFLSQGRQASSACFEVKR